jgi:hypothetical protein
LQHHDSWDNVKTAFSGGLLLCPNSRLLFDFCWNIHSSEDLIMICDMNGQFQNTNATKFKIKPLFFWFSIFVVSLIIRLYNISIPFEIHEFRQAQTAITVQSFLREGISLLKYKVPVFGEHSIIPFEFPVFQLSCYGMHKFINLLTPIRLDLACRLTNLVYFYLSCIFLYLLVDLMLIEKKAPKYVLCVYLFNPFCIIWSRTSMIDFCSVFFSLGYAFFLIYMLKNGIKKYVALSLVFGIMAYLSKITTVVSVGLIITFYFFEYFTSFPTDALLKKRGVGVLALGAISVLIPFCCGWAWTKWTDYVKSLYGQEWLTSSSLLVWNLGTMSERLIPINWWIIIKRMFFYFSPVAWLCSIGICAFTRNKQDLKIIGVVVFSFILPVFVFFNLYKVHDYYMIAIAPEICIVLGYGVYCFVNYCIQRKKQFVVVCIVFFYVFSFPLARYYFQIYFNTPSYFIDRENLLLANYINRNTNNEDRILIMDEDWSSEILFYAEREGFMLKREAEKTLPGRNYFSMIALRSEESHKEILSSLAPLVFLNEIGKWKIYMILK